MRVAAAAVAAAVLCPAAAPAAQHAAADAPTRRSAAVHAEFLPDGTASFVHAGRVWRAQPDAGPLRARNDPEEGAPEEKPESECEEEQVYTPGSGQWISALCVSLSCLFVAACAAGLTISVAGVSAIDLEMKEQAALRYQQMYDEEDVQNLDERDQEARQELLSELPTVKRLLPIISGPIINSDTGQRGVTWYWSPHGLLVSLLIINAAANEILPLYLDHLLPHWAVIAVSICLVLIFGEILPSALFSSDRMLWAHRLYPLVQFLRLLTWPLSLPLAKVLDNVVGHDEEADQMRKEELRALIQMHKRQDIRKQRKQDHSYPAALTLLPVPESEVKMQKRRNPEEHEWVQHFRGAHRCESKLQDSTGRKVGFDVDDQDPPDGLERMGTGVEAEAIEITDARFRAATKNDLVHWLNQVFQGTTRLTCSKTAWLVDQEPMSTERRGQGTDRAWVSFRSEQDCKEAIACIRKAKDTVRLFGWIGVECMGPHRPEGAAGKFEELDHYEVEIMTAALDLDQKLVKNELADDMFALGHLDSIASCRQLIYESGFSRIPVFNVHEAIVAKNSSGELGLDVGANCELRNVSGPAKEVGFLAPGGWVGRPGTQKGRKAARIVVAIDGRAVKTQQEFVAATAGAGPFRIRVDEHDVVRGVLLTKSLAQAEPKKGATVGDYCLLPVSMVAIAPTDNLHDVLQVFQARKKHIALVTNSREVFEECWQQLDSAARGETAAKAEIDPTISADQMKTPLVRDLTCAQPQSPGVGGLESPAAETPAGQGLAAGAAGPSGAPMRTEPESPITDPSGGLDKKSQLPPWHIDSGVKNTSQDIIQGAETPSLLDTTTSPRGWRFHSSLGEAGDAAVLRLREAAPSVLGVLTLEDVLEELVGDIDDEWDARRQYHQSKEERRQRRAHQRDMSYRDLYAHGLPERARSEVFGASAGDGKKGGHGLVSANAARKARRPRAHSTATDRYHGLSLHESGGRRYGAQRPGPVDDPRQPATDTGPRRRSGSHGAAPTSTVTAPPGGTLQWDQETARTSTGQSAHLPRPPPTPGEGYDVHDRLLGSLPGRPRNNT